MLEALMVNAAILIATVLALWLISVRINDVSFIDAFWGSGMGLMALVSWWQVRPVPGPDDREGIVGRGVHQHTTPSEDFMRGSMTSLTACATRLLSMTIAPVISTMSISRL